MSSENTALPEKRSVFRRILAPEERVRRPGYIGKLPYLLALRWLTVFGIVLRISLHWSEYAGRVTPNAIAVAIAVLLALAHTYRAAKLSAPLRPSAYLKLVMFDILIVSVAYIGTKNTQSDMFLFYFLPILTSAEHLSGRKTASTVTVSGVAFALVVYSIHAVQQQPASAFGVEALRVVLPRLMLFVGLGLTAWYFFRQEKLQNERVDRLITEAEDQTRRLDRAREEIAALFNFSVEADQSPIGVLTAQAVDLAIKSLGANWGVAYVEAEDNSHLVIRPADCPPPALRRGAEQIVAAFKSGKTGGRRALQSDGASWLIEELTTGKRLFGVIGIAVLDSLKLDENAGALLKALTIPLANALRRAHLMASFRRITRETLRTLEFDRELDATLREATADHQVEQATITLKDDYRAMVETVRGRNVPPGLIRMSRYPLSAKDVQTHVIATGETMLIEGNHELFCQEIYERFEHHKLARMWVPLKSETGEVIGALEAGCAREKMKAVFTPGRQAALEELGVKKGKALAELRPQMLLHRIAEDSIRLIGADSASIHIYQASDPPSRDSLRTMIDRDITVQFHYKDPILAAGAGGADAGFIRKYAPRQDGIGWETIAAMLRTGVREPKPVDNEDDLARRNPGIHGEGIRAILAVPLLVAPDVVGALFVHFRSPHRFTPQEIQLERVFAGQIEVAIQGHLLFCNVTAAVQDSRTLLEWLNVIQSPAILKDSFPVLQELAQKLLLVADADNVVLYPYLQPRGVFLAPPIVKGNLRDEAAIKDKIGAHHLVWSLIGGPLPLFYENTPLERPDLTSLDGQKRFIAREEILSCAILPLRARPDDELLGLLFVNYRKARRFSPEDRTTMQALAATAAVAIRSARYYEWLENRRQHIMALRVIDQEIVTSAKARDERAILEAILKEAVLVTRASTGAFLRMAGQAMTVAAQKESQYCGGSRWTGTTGPISVCSRGQHSLLITKLEEADARLHPNSQSAIAVRVADRDELFGVICLEHTLAGFFSNDDLTILESLAIQAVIAIHAIDNYRKLDLEHRRTEAIGLIATHIQGAGCSLDLALYLILTGITSGKSLGFSRAMLFVRDENGTVLKGKCAIGETTKERASLTWKRAPADDNTPLRDALKIAEQHYHRIAAEEVETPLMKAVSSIQIPLHEEVGAVARCALQDAQKATEVPVAADQPDPFRRSLLAKTGCADGGVPFVCVPLIGREETIGVLVVDNRFLHCERDPIPKEMVHALYAYAELAAMSIENARLSERTQTRAYEDLAHQLRQPIALAKHHVERLADAGAVGFDAPRLATALAAVRKAARVSLGLRVYARLAANKPLPINISRLDSRSVKALVREAMDELKVMTDPRRGISFALNDGSFDLLNGIQVSTDLSLLAESLGLLLDNASKYSYNQTTIGVCAETIDTDEFAIVVENTGFPITQKETATAKLRGWQGELAKGAAGEGGGIGLWLVDNMMKAIEGRLVVNATDANGRNRIGLHFKILARNANGPDPTG